MLNHVTIMGRLVRDPELRRTSSGIAVTSFTVAVDRDIPNSKTNERETDFIDCVAWRATGEFVAKYFTKGRMIVVDGRLQVRNWDDKDGNKRRTTEINADNCYFGDSKKPEEQNAPGGYGAPQSYGAPNGYAAPQNGYGAPGGYGNPQSYGAPNNYGAPPQGGGYDVPPADQSQSYQSGYNSYGGGYGGDDNRFN